MSGHFARNFFWPTNDPFYVINFWEPSGFLSVQKMEFAILAFLMPFNRCFMSHKLWLSCSHIKVFMLIGYQSYPHHSIQWKYSRNNSLNNSVKSIGWTFTKYFLTVPFWVRKSARWLLEAHETSKSSALSIGPPGCSMK